MRSLFQPNNTENGNDCFSTVLFCCLLNAQSMANKLKELHYMLYNSGYDLIFVTESWLNPNFTKGCL